MAAPALAAKYVGKKLLKNKHVQRFIIGCVLFSLLAPFMFFTLLFGGADAQAAGSCAAPGGGPAGKYVPSSTRQANPSIINIIYSVGKQRNVSDEVMLSAFVVAYVETQPGPRNLASAKYPESMQYPNDGTVAGDGRSIGIYQQQVGGSGTVDNKSWGTIKQIMDPAHAAGRYFDNAVLIESRLKQKTGQQPSFATIGHRVQASAFPAKYQDTAIQQAARSQIAQAAASTGSQVGPPSGVPGTPGTPAPIPTAGTSGWVNPLAGNPPLTSPFGFRIHPISGIRKLHAGQDYGVPTGTPVMAINAGTVIKSGTAGGYGIAVYIDHGQNVVSEYGHLSQTQVRDGQRVTAGQQIALSGNTGGSTGPHLHMTIRVNGTAVDPIEFLKTQGAISVQGGTVACSPVDGSLTDPGPGAQGGTDKLTPRARNLKQVIENRYGCAANNNQAPCITVIHGQRDSDAVNSDHPEGRAIDIMLSNNGEMPPAHMRQFGDEIAAFVTTNATALGVDNVIWEQQYWSISDPRWDPMKDRGSITANHFDHVHVSMKKN